MISTETAAVNAVPAPAPKASHAGQRRQRDADHDRHEDRGDAVGEPLHGRLARLRRLDEARDLRERRVGADPRRPHDEAAVRVDGRAGELGAGGDLERHRLAGEQRPVDRRLALDDDAVGRDLLAGADEEHVAHPELGDGDELLGAVAAKHARLLRAELEQPPDRRRRAALRARLEVAAEQDQRRDDRRDLEVRVGVDAADEDDRRPEPRGERADRDERVHRRRARGVRSRARRDGSRRRRRRRPGSRARAPPTPSRRSGAPAPSPAARPAASARARARAAGRAPRRARRGGGAPRARARRRARRSRPPRPRRRARRRRPTARSARLPARSRS